MLDVKKFQSCFIAGSPCQGASADALEVHDKFHGEVIATLPYADQAQVDAALESTVRGHKALSGLSAGARSQGLHQLALLLVEHKEALTNIIIAEAGKPRSYASVEIDRAVATLETAAEEAIRFCGEVINIDHHNGQGRTAVTQRVPRGPIAAISPFNFPLNLAVHKIAPALAVGCSVILKPSPFTPLTALYLAHLCSQTDLPQDALNVVVCDNQLAERIVTSPAIAMVSFTGSDTVGWHIKSLVPKKPVALELGGNGAVIVDSDANIDVVAQKLISGAFLYAGQICISTQRVYVHKSLYKALLQSLKEKMQSIVVGDPTDKSTVVGPMIDAKAYQKVSTMVQQALEQGARIVAQTEIPLERHNFFPATLLTNTTEEMSIVQDEAFAPVCVVESVDTIDEAIATVNNSRYGLQAGVFSNSISTMQQCFATLEVGGVIMNDVPGFRVDVMPYGGVKDSGLGREGPRYAMEEMTETRLLVY